MPTSPYRTPPATSEAKNESLAERLAWAAISCLFVWTLFVLINPAPSAPAWESGSTRPTIGGLAAWFFSPTDNRPAQAPRPRGNRATRGR